MAERCSSPVSCPDCGHRLRYPADEPLTKRLVCWPGGCEAAFDIEHRLDLEQGLQHRTLYRISDQVRAGEPIPLEPIRITEG